MFARGFKSILSIGFLALMAASAPVRSVEPQRGTPEFKAVVSTAGKLIEQDLGSDVGLDIRRIDIEGDWAYMHALLRKRSGAPLDWAQTKFAQAWASKAISDSVMALLRRDGGQWRVVEYSLGPVGPIWQVWVSRHRAPRALFVPGAPAADTTLLPPKAEQPAQPVAPPVPPKPTQPVPPPPMPQGDAKPLPTPPIHTPPAPQTVSAPPIEVPAVPPPPTVPAPKFKRDDPCDAAGQMPRGAPWAAPVGTPVRLEGEAVSVRPPMLDISRFTVDSLKASIATAKQQLLIVYGGLTADNLAAFETAWAPLEEYPAPETAKYLNALNPLLARFIATRTAFETAALSLQAILMEAAVAVEAGDEKALRTSRAEAAARRNDLIAHQRALQTIGRQIEALGNPPNPMPAACKAHKRGKPDAPGKTLFDVIMEEPWVQLSVYRGGTHAFVPSSTMMSFNKRTKVADGNTITLIDEVAGFGQPNCGLANPQVHFSVDGIALRRVIMEFRFSADRRRIENLSAKIEEQNCKMARLLNREQKLWEMSGGAVQLHSEIRLANVPADKTEIVTTPKAQAVQIVLDGHEATSLIQRATSSPYWTETFASKLHGLFEKGSGPPPGDRIVVATGRGMTAYTSDLFLSAVFWASSVGDATMANGNKLGSYGKSFAAQSTPVATPPATIASGGQTAAEAAAAKAAAEQALKDEVTFQQSVIAMIAKNLERDLAELAAAANDPKADPDRLGALQFRAIHQASNLTEEQDRLRALTTGVVTKSRTAFDEYASTLFRKSLQEEAQEADQKLKLARGARKLAQLAPEEERATLAAQVERTLTPAAVVRMNVDEVRRATGAIHDQVAGHWQKRAAKSDEEAVDAAENEFYAGLTATAAGMLVVGLSAPAFAQAYGAEAAATVLAPTLTGALYGATTGGIEGGPVGAVRGALQWSGQIGYLGVTAYDGWFGHEPGDKPGGLIGAMQSVGTAVLVGKAMSIGIRVASAGANAVKKAVIGTPKMTAAEWREANRFKAEVAQGRVILRNYEAQERRLAEAIAQKRPIQEIAEIEKLVDKLAATLNGNYHAKWWLKHHGSLSTRTIFDQRVNAYYDVTEAKMMKTLSEKYDTSTIDWVKLRNASSVGSVGMDLDLALVEVRGVPTIIKLRNGKRADMFEFQKDAQKAFNQHYEGLTGVSGKQSELNITTRIHSEAFADPALLEQKIDWNAIDSKRIHNVGEVTAFKGQHAANQNVSAFTGMQETCRQASKDIDGKLIAYFEYRASAAKNPADKAKFADLIAFWKDVGGRFKQIGTQEMDPVKIWQQSLDIRRTTGGRSVFDLVQDMKGHLETASKFIK